MSDQSPAARSQTQLDADVAELKALAAKEHGKLAAFVDTHEETIAGLQLRPLTAGSWTVLRMTKNPLMSDGPAVEDANLEFAVAGFLFAHSAPILDVRRAAMDPEKWADAVFAFLEKMTITDFVDASKQVRVIIASAMVGKDYELQDGEKKTATVSSQSGSPATA